MKDILEKYRLLYAEDDLEVQKEMAEYLRYYFKEVIVVSNGKEALTQYKKHKPDVLLLDIYMPKLNGLELTEYIREHDHKVKIAIVSAHSKNDLMLKAINSSVNYYIIKPATIKKIKEMLQKISTELAREHEDRVELLDSFYYSQLNHKLYCADKEVELTYKESRLLQLLMKNRGCEVCVEDIIVWVWGEEKYFDISVDSVKSQVSYLRKKLPANVIQTVYGGGYLLSV